VVLMLRIHAAWLLSGRQYILEFLVVILQFDLKLLMKIRVHLAVRLLHVCVFWWWRQLLLPLSVCMALTLRSLRHDWGEVV